MEELFKLLGLGTPFLYAGGTYALFHWLDTKTSDEAKAELSRLLNNSKDYDTPQVATFVVDIFDKVYTKPLRTLRAFVRSGLITLLVALIFIYESESVLALHYSSRLAIEGLYIEYGITNIYIQYIITFVHDFFQPLLLNVITDYLSLFIVRYWLVIAGRRPIVALLACSLISVFVVLAGLAVRLAIGALVIIIRPQDYPLAEVSIPFFADVFFEILTNPTYLIGTLLLPAMVVFLWLPLFGASVGLIRLLHFFVPVVGKVQWFLKDGRQQPLDAVGFAAGAIVFSATAVWKYLIPSPV